MSSFWVPLFCACSISGFCSALGQAFCVKSKMLRLLDVTIIFVLMAGLSVGSPWGFLGGLWGSLWGSLPVLEGPLVGLEEPWGVIGGCLWGPWHSMEFLRGC